MGAIPHVRHSCQYVERLTTSRQRARVGVIRRPAAPHWAAPGQRMAGTEARRCLRLIVQAMVHERSWNIVCILEPDNTP